MSNLPLVSICIPTYNGALFLQESLQSVLDQTYQNIEVVISDDASTDGTLELLENFKEQVTCPITIHHHTPSGIGANWNNCVRNSKGTYIKFLFQDDILLANCIERMVQVALIQENVGLVYCKREIIYNKDNKYDARWVSNFKSLHDKWHTLQVNEGVLPGKDYLKDKFLLDSPRNKIGEPPAVLLHRDCFEKAGYFNTILDQALDIEYWYRLMPFFNIGFVDEVLIKFRLHEAQASQKNKKRKTKDARLLPKIILKKLFWHLHTRQKINVLKDVFQIKKLENFLKKVKRKFIN